ncbi:hypothetical protein [uncultured Chryseobacterium sp.]|uniref:hypothetical protein n=1 Tax=uncultured Chryseobacterium sp. TaxID=259322 RepID=UPI0025E9DF27|nr:hypothetical protein [uncultured Chryseobacterium sp.]
MKNFLLLTSIAFSCLVHAQKTRVLALDLSTPTEKSLRFEDGEGDSARWLSVRSADLISLKLIKGNPLKYSYRINGAPITLFMNADEWNRLFSEPSDNKEAFAKQYDAATYESLPKKNEKLEKRLENLEITLDRFELENTNKESLDDDFKKDRALLFDTLKQANYEAHANKACLEQGMNNPEYKNLLSEEEKAKAEKNIKSNIDQADKMLKSFETKYFFSNEFYTLPMEHQGKNIDAIEFTVKRVNKETNAEDETFTGKYKVWITGGMKIDISAGVFLTSLFDKEYEARDISDDSGNKEIVLKNRGNYDFAFGSTINTNFRINSWVQPQLSFGAVFTQNQKFQLILGGGIILGREERWILSGGLSMGVVDRLADRFQAGGIYDLGTSGQVPTIKQFKFGHFFGITYNLSKVNTISIKPK